MSLNLVYRNKKPNDIHFGKWDGLGGKFESDETPEEWVQRQIFEESGITIHNPRPHGLLLFMNFKGNDRYVFVYTATEFTGEMIDSCESTLEWIPDEKITSLKLWDRDHIFRPWLKEEKFFSAKLEYDGDQMRRYNVLVHSWND